MGEPHTIMADEKKTAAPDIAAIVPERANFKTLILGNPNYFGTFPKLGAPVKPKSFDTAFEQLMCLGLNPQQDRLEAVVDIKRNSGYNTDACGGGRSSMCASMCSRALRGWTSELRRSMSTIWPAPRCR